MDLAVEFEGVSKNEATDMSVHYKGLAQQIGDKWIIVKKAVITLKKIINYYAFNSTYNNYYYHIYAIVFLCEELFAYAPIQ